MKKFWYISFSILILLSMILAACTPAAEAPAAEAPAAEAPAAEAPAAEAPAAAKEPVVLKFLKITDELEAQALVEAVAAFQKSEGGKWSYVSVEVDAKPFAELFPAIEKAVATGSDIDIVQADGPDVKHFAYNGVLKDLTEYFTPEELAQWAPQSIAEGSFNGKFYGPPECQSCQLMWFNKDMLDAAGVDYSDTAGWTYGTGGTALPNWQKLTKDENGDGTPEVFGFETAGPWDYYWRIPARSNGEVGSATYQGISDDGITYTGYFDTPESAEAYSFIKDMVYEYKVMSAERVQNQLLSGLSATNFSQDMVIGTQKNQFPDFKLGGIEPPYFVTPLCQTGSWHWGITSTTDNFEEALAFVKFLASDEGAQFIWKYKNQLPANVNLYNTIDEFTDPANPRSLMAKFFTQYGAPRIETPSYTEYNALFTQFFNSLLAGEEDVQGLLTEYAGLMDEAAAKYSDWKSK